MAHRLIIEHRESGSVLICNRCQKPFLEISDGKVRFQNKHGSQIHKNELTIDHLRVIAFEMYRQSRPPSEGWTF
jgi:hypothetical protein